MGELVDIGPQEKTYRISGLYVLPEPIQSSGMLLSIEAIGPTRKTDRFLFNMLLYHQLCNGSFQLYNEHTTSHNTSGFVRVDYNISVKKGDRIGVRVDSECQKSCFKFSPAFASYNCPVQVLYNASNDVNNFETITNVFLNVRASIGKLHSCCMSVFTANY